MICSLEKVCRGKLTGPKKGLRFLQRLAFSDAACSPRTSVTQGPVSSHWMREREHISFEKRVGLFPKSSFDYDEGGCCSLPASGLLFMSGAPTNERPRLLMFVISLARLHFFPSRLGDRRQRKSYRLWTPGDADLFVWVKETFPGINSNTYKKKAEFLHRERGPSHHGLSCVRLPIEAATQPDSCS